MLLKRSSFNLVCTACMRQYDVCSGNTFISSTCVSSDCPSHEHGHIGLHSPGNWQVEDNTLYVLNEDENNRFDATIRRGLKCAGKVEIEANLLLMGAAPEMAEALIDTYRLMLKMLDSDKEDVRLALLEIEHALTKANIDFKTNLGLSTSLTDMLMAEELMAA